MYLAFEVILSGLRNFFFNIPMREQGVEAEFEVETPNNSRQMNTRGHC